MPVAVIALATWQGAHHLPALLNSLVLQERRPDLVVTGDDGSSDGSPDLIEAWSQQTGIPVQHLPKANHRLGPCGNFARILTHCQTIPQAIVFLCDQDDFWHPEKIARGMRLMNDRIPRLLVHDLRLIDANGNLVAESYWKHQGYRPHHGVRPEVLVAMNSFPGCAMVCNQALLARALPIPPQAVMHDWWLALVAVASGRIRIDSQCLVDYRQHAHNTVGAVDSGVTVRFRRIARVLTAEYRQESQTSRRQAQALGRHLGPGLPTSMRAWAISERLDPMRRRIVLLRHGVRKTGWLRSLGLLSQG